MAPQRPADRSPHWSRGVLFCSTSVKEFPSLQTPTVGRPERKKVLANLVGSLAPPPGSVRWSCWSAGGVFPGFSVVFGFEKSSRMIQTTDSLISHIQQRFAAMGWQPLLPIKVAGLKALSREKLEPVAAKVNAAQDRIGAVTAILEALIPLEGATEERQGSDSGDSQVANARQLTKTPSHKSGSIE